MVKCLSLVDLSVFRVENLRISCKHYIFNYLCAVVHLNVIVTDFLLLQFLVLIVPLLSLLSVVSHHVLFSNLVKSVPHLLESLLLEALESIKLNEMDVLEGALRRLLLHCLEKFRQDRIGWYDGPPFLLVRCLGSCQARRSPFPRWLLIQIPFDGLISLNVRFDSYQQIV